MRGLRDSRSYPPPPMLLLLLLLLEFFLSSAAGHAPAIAVARVMRAQQRAVAALKTCASCVAAGGLWGVMVTALGLLIAGISTSISSPSSQRSSGSCVATTYEACQALECPHLCRPRPHPLLAFCPNDLLRALAR